MRLSRGAGVKHGEGKAPLVGASSLSTPGQWGQVNGDRAATSVDLLHVSLGREQSRWSLGTRTPDQSQLAGHSAAVGKPDFSCANYI